MSIRFYLDASPDFEGNTRIREHYEFKKYNAEKKADELLCGMVDEGIIKQHEKQYGFFSAYVAAHKDELYKKLHAEPLKPLYFDYQPKEEAKEEKPEPKKKKGFLATKPENEK